MLFSDFETHSFGGFPKTYEPRPRRIYKDIWCYDPITSKWEEIKQAPYGAWPSARTGHSAAVVGDIMYVFGGRKEYGMNFTNELTAFNLGAHRWEVISNYHGHTAPPADRCLVAVGKELVVLGGDRRSASRAHRRQGRRCWSLRA